jgi:predicted phosphodiesterase
MKTRSKRVFGFTDIHWENRDDEALHTAMAAMEDFKPDIVVIGGDLLDCSPFSHHPRKKMVEGLGRGWNERELVPAIQFLDWVQDRTSYTYFLEGNHEEWIERFCMTGGAAYRAIYDIISPKRNLSRGRKNFKYISYTNTKGTSGGCVKLSPRLSVVHGWTTCKHAAAKHLELSRTRSIIFHHTHRRQMATGRDPWSGQPIEAFSAGCLCKLQPIYAHGGSPTEWTHGFWVAYLGKHSYTAYPIPIIKGAAVLPDGRKIIG